MHAFDSHPRGSRRWTAPLIILLALAAVPSLRAQTGTPPSVALDTTVVPSGFDMSAVEGLSWLNRRGLDFDKTCFGRAGRLAQSPVSLPEATPPGPASSAFTIRGQDLYRYSCRSCHKPDGSGCGEEIKPLVDPVRSTTVAVIREGMEARGISLPEEMLESLAAQNEETLRQRLAQGGEKMPYFEYLKPPELETLLQYLRILARVPGADANPPDSLRATPFRVGELIVKGTCQTCHNANDPGFYDNDVNRKHEIPSLNWIRSHRTVDEVVNKARHGAIRAGARRGNMPIFSFLTGDEIRAAYIYLVAFPPGSGKLAARE